MNHPIPPQSRYVFSANYFNRASAFPWLVRRADQPVCRSVPCLSIEARHVVFTAAGAEEQGHGCTLTAIMEVQGRESVQFGPTFEGRAILPLEPLPEHVRLMLAGMEKRAELLWLPGLEPIFTRLRFQSGGFTVEETGEPVESVHTLRLNEDRSITAILYPACPAPVLELPDAA